MSNDDSITNEAHQKDLEIQLEFLMSKELISKLMIELVKTHRVNYNPNDEAKYSTFLFYKNKLNEYERYKKILEEQSHEITDQLNSHRDLNTKIINEINRVTEEKIECVHEKDKLELQIEKYKYKRRMNTSSIFKTMLVPTSLFYKEQSEILETQGSVAINTMPSTNGISTVRKKDKMKKIKDLQKQISNFSKMINDARKNYEETHKKNFVLIEENKVFKILT